LKVDIGKNEMRIAQPLCLAKMTGDKFTVKLFWQTKYSQAILIYKEAKKLISGKRTPDIEIK
jgi:hypothetical protein